MGLNISLGNQVPLVQGQMEEIAAADPTKDEPGN